jgi:histone demethylase JARID1
MVVPPASAGPGPSYAVNGRVPGLTQFSLAKPEAVTPTSANSNALPNSMYPVYASHLPISMRRAPPLDMNTVERRGHPLAVRETSKRSRPHGLQEAPTFRPSEEEFKDPMEYIRKITPEGAKYGICKVIPPDNWQPEFAIDTEVSFHRTL